MQAGGADYYPKEVESYYPEFLAAMNEPSIYGLHLDKNTEKYRFLWLRTFHKPIAIRVWKDHTGISLRIVRLSGKGGYKTGHIERDESFALTPAQWSGFLKLLDEAAFWDMPSVNRDVAFADGSQWILEGKVGDKYHVVDRKCPLDDSGKRHLDSFVACCRYLLKLSGEEIPVKENY
jgi:hypothetical protein